MVLDREHVYVYNVKSYVDNPAYLIKIELMGWSNTNRCIGDLLKKNKYIIPQLHFFVMALYLILRLPRSVSRDRV